MKNNNIAEATKPSGQLAVMNQTEFEKLYVAQNYKGAAQYLLDNKQSFESGIFHLNLGTVYAKDGQFAAARFHLEKAIKEGEVSTDVFNNLSFVKSKLEVSDLETSSVLSDQALSTALAIPSVTYNSMTLVLIILVLILIIRKSIQKISLIVLFLILSFIPTGINLYISQKVHVAVALQEIVIHEGPSKIFSEKGKVQAGAKIILGEYKDGWFFIKSPLNLSGWINKDHLGLY